MKGCQLNWRALNLHHIFMNFELIFISKEKCLLWGPAMQKNVSSWVLTFAFQLLFVVMPCIITLFDRFFLQYHRTKGGVPIFAFSSNASLCTTTSTQQSHRLLKVGWRLHYNFLMQKISSGLICFEKRPRPLKALSFFNKLSSSRQGIPHLSLTK